MPVFVPAIGATFASSYRVLRLLGRGGMGAVYAAEQLTTGARRALKLMHPELCADERLLRMFQQEARVGHRIASDHVIQVLDAGVDDATGTPWIAMELLEGEHLGARIERAGALSRDEAGEILGQIGHALAAAHAIGVVHRDIKPENVFLAPSRREGAPRLVKLLDFGIAKIVAESRPQSTVIGTPLWMAPEQLTGAAVSAGTDVWAFGLLAFWMLIGRSYWAQAGGIQHLLDVIARREPPTTASARAAELGCTGVLPTEFDAWFARCTAVDPCARFADASGACGALRRVLDVEQPTVRAQPSDAPGAPAPAGEPATGARRGPALPAPGHCIGRDATVERLTGALLGEPSARLPILGPAGIGKSTVSLAVLHRREIEDRYGLRRWFVRLDAAPSAEAAEGALAAALRIEGGPDLRARLLAELGHKPGLLVLDNLETPWEHDARGTEDLLSELAALRQLAVVASVRGGARPGGAAWMPAVQIAPLGEPEAVDLFCAIAGEHHRHDPALPPLLSRMEGVPLAVTLLAYAAEQNDLRNLAAEWEAQRTALLARSPGHADRLTSWSASVEVSLGSRRMTAEARRLAALLGALPDGIAQQDLAALLPVGGPGAARVLAQVGLASFEGGRLRALSPVREHLARAHPPEPADLKRAMQHYRELATTLGPQPGSAGGAEAVARLAPEVANLEAIIRRGLTGADAGPWIDAATALTRFARLSGRTAPSALGQALEVARALDDAPREARCTEHLGHFALERMQYEEARRLYEQAQRAYEPLGDVLGAADCIRSLGDIALERSRHEEARRLYEQARPLYQQVGSVLGEAHCIKRLGDVALRRSQYEEARRMYEQALPSYRRMGSVLGEANCIRSLGDIALEQSQDEDARRMYEQAWPLYRQQAGCVLGQAHCIKRLGDIAMARSQHEEARELYDRARPLYQQVGSVLGEANCLKRLGDIALEQSQYQEARRLYAQAQHLYQQVGSVLGEANCTKGLGDIALQSSCYDEAYRSYELVRPVYQEVGDVLGEAQCAQGLGDAALARSDLHDARTRYEEALALYATIPDPLSMGHIYRRLARLASTTAEKRHHVDSARTAWLGIERQDLVAELDDDLNRNV